MTGPAPDHVTLSGLIDDGGQFAFRRADPATGATRSQVSESGYHYEVHDAAGQVIDRRPAVVRPYPACQPRGLRVTATVRLTVDARSVRLRDAEGVLWDAAVPPAHDITVRIARAPSRESGAALDISVQGASEPAYVRVSWQREGTHAGTEAIVIAPAQPFSSSLGVDLSWAPGGAGSLVVTVGAGVRVASARSESLTLPPLGTSLSLHQPTNGSRVAPGCSVLASAGVVDRDNPETSPVAAEVEWLVDEQVAGSGLQTTLPAMTPGRHTVTVRLPSAPTVASSVVLTVDDAESS